MKSLYPLLSFSSLIVSKYDDVDNDSMTGDDDVDSAFSNKQLAQFKQKYLRVFTEKTIVWDPFYL